MLRLPIGKSNYISPALVWIALVGCCGCRLSNPSEHSALAHHPRLLHQEAVGHVTTGGLFARNRELEIPPSGLTLGDAVSASLRPGLQRPIILTTSHAAAQAPPSTQGRPLIDSTTLLEKTKQAIRDHEGNTQVLKIIVDSIVRDFRSDSESAIASIKGFLLSENAMKVTRKYEAGRRATDDEILLDRLLQTMKSNGESPGGQLSKVDAGKAQDTFRTLVRAEPSQIPNSQAIKDAFRPLIESELVLEAVASWMDGHKAELVGTANLNEKQMSVLAGIESLLASAAKGTADGTGKDEDPSDSAASQMSAPGNSGAIVDPTSDAVVILRRPKSATRIIPLMIVQSTPVGDIALVDGDRVNVMPFARTTLASRSTAKSPTGSIAVSGIVQGTLDLAAYANLQAVSDSVQQSKFGQLADIMVLGTPDADGRVEEYWFPRNSATSMVQVAAADLSAITLEESDAIRVTAMELMPIIRRSRMSRRIDQLDEQRVTRLRQVLEQKEAQEQDLVHSVTSNALYQTVSRNLNRLSPLNW